MTIPTQAESPAVSQSGYSTSLLREPIFDMVQVAVETAAINNWLNKNYEQLTLEEMKGPREHLYYLIDSYVKGIYSRESKILPAEGDLTLQTLFSWAERLGVYGGSLVYNTVKLPDTPVISSSHNLPSGISLTLNGDLLSLNDESQGWGFKVPYYFMVWKVSDFIPEGFTRTQLVALSTGASRDDTEAGRSQSTIMFMFVPETDSETAEKYWKASFDIPETASRKALGEDIGKSFYAKQGDLHKEIVSWDGPQGAMVVVYLGMQGSYQWNRPHFLDFLNSVQQWSESAPNR